jgi:hypothetical protein
LRTEPFSIIFSAHLEEAIINYFKESMKIKKESQLAKLSRDIDYILFASIYHVLYSSYTLYVRVHVFVRTDTRFVDKWKD